MTTPRLEVYIAANKNFYFPVENRCYRVLGLGGYSHRGVWPPECDLTGDNISAKNHFYSELSGLYWLAKSKVLPEFIGLAHYRRLFLLDPSHPEFASARILRRDPSYEVLAYLTSDRWLEFSLNILEQDLTIIPRPIPIGESIVEHYKRHHTSEDWDLFIIALKEVLGHGANDISFFESSKLLVPYNMAIWRSSFFKNYVECLFSILNWMELQMPVIMKDYQCRWPAFISERFFTYYISIYQLKTLHVPIVLLDKNAS